MRYFIEVSYDGTAFHGSQIQEGQRTVQGTLNSALSTLLRRPLTTFGASRTDEGVHAHCNFYHFDEEAPVQDQLLYKLNAILPPAMSVRNIYTSNKIEANARFDAVSRSYRYRIYRKKNPFLYQRAMHYPFRLDREVLDQTASILKEYTHFETFSKRNTQSRTFTCTIFRSVWETQGDELHFVVEANRFLRGMVRGLVGTQLQVARGRCDVARFREIIEAADCTKADFSVPGHGLYLERVQYPEGYLIPYPQR